MHPVSLKDGALLVPLANENFNIAAMAITRDGGETWTFSRPVPGIGRHAAIGRPAARRTLLAFFRDATPSHRIHRSESTDGGLTWSPVTPTSLPNPGGGIEAIALASGDLAIIYNDKERARAIAWPCPSRRIGDRPGLDAAYSRTHRGSVSTIRRSCRARDGSLHATYSYNLQTIKHVTFNEAWIKEAVRR